jgi:hypothetical protein
MGDLIKDQNDALRAQNNAPAWLDCNARDKKHRWFLAHFVEGGGAWFHCRRCPVSTRTEGAHTYPAPFLRGGDDR